MKKGYCQRLLDSIMNEREKAELLTFWVETGNLDLNIVKKEHEVSRREELLRKHSFMFWESKTRNCWYTYLPDEIRGRVQIRRKTKEELEDVVVNFYREKEENPRLDELFHEWLSKKLVYKEIQKGSADRYETDFIRFFVETGFSRRKIKSITADELEEFIRLQIAEQELTMKAFSGLRIIVRGMWMYAKKKKLTDISISEFFGDLHISRNVFKRTVKESRDEVFSEEEIPVLADYLKQKGTLWSLGVLLVLQTGLRVGELSALKRSDWDEKQTLKVRRTEVRYKDDTGHNKVTVREFAKTKAGMRDVILSEGGCETLRRIVNLNPDGDFLFENNRKRIRGNTFNKTLDRALKSLGMHHRSIHKGRKTYGTLLIDSGCEDSLVMNQLGHTTVETSRKYYYFSNRTIKHQVEQIQRAISI